MRYSFTLLHFERRDTRRHGVASAIELIPIQNINEACERMLGSDVKYRWVIDMASLRKKAAAA